MCKMRGGTSVWSWNSRLTKDMSEKATAVKQSWVWGKYTVHAYMSQTVVKTAVTMKEGCFRENPRIVYNGNQLTDNFSKGLPFLWIHYVAVLAQPCE